MFDFLKNFIYSIIDLYVKLLPKNSCLESKSTYSHKTSKKAFSAAASFELGTQTQKNKEKVESGVAKILKSCKHNPNDLLQFVEKSGTKVYKIPFARQMLAGINFEEGFIGETKGFKSLYLTVILAMFSNQKIKIGFNTQPMFVLKNSQSDEYHLIQHFHKWYSMKLDLPGFDVESQENFQKFLSASNDSKIKELSIDEILGLKEAIARDVESINFIVEFAKSTAGSKNALKKITAGGASV